MLFHHAQGLTPGVRAFADELRAAGHDVHTPDMYEGRTFESIEQGVAHARQVGFDVIMERGRTAGQDAPAESVYAGFSLGVMPAQALAQTRPGARGAILISAALPPSEFGSGWPEGVPLQIHAMADDPWMEEDLDVAREIAATVSGAELYLYPGSGHLFTDRSLPDYDERATALLMQRVLDFLQRV